jgi:predicted metallo-beta-lactamase superfamily hydrolase
MNGKELKKEIKTINENIIIYSCIRVRRKTYNKFFKILYAYKLGQNTVSTQKEFEGDEDQILEHFYG